MNITIITPTYNRSNELKRLYDSLEKQTVKEFAWLIVDDGSKDRTCEEVKKFQNTASFPIRYIYKENGGKHTALNRGIREIRTELTFIVDSDDWLKENAIETVLKYHEKYSNYNALCGYSFLRAFSNGQVNGKKFVPNEWIASYIQTRVNSNDQMADKAEVFYTRCLKEFPFPEFRGESFLGEDIVWVRMARKYQMVHINEVIYIGEYQTDGLTKNRRKNNINSAIGCTERAKEFMKRDINIRYRLKASLQYVVYGKFSGKSIKDLIDESEFKFMTAVSSIPGMMLWKKWGGCSTSHLDNHRNK